MNRDIAKPIRVSDLHISGNLIGVIHYKSVFAPFIIGGLGLALIAFIPDFSVKMIGTAMAALAVFNSIFVKDRKIMEVYDDSIVIYPEADTCMKIMNEDIAEWNVNSHGQSAIYIRLIDGRSNFIRTYNTEKASDYLKLALPGKSTFQQSIAKHTDKSDGFLHVLKANITKK